MPRGLAPEARSEWKRILPMLEQMGVLTVVDGTALAAYCSTYAMWRQADRHISKFGLVYATVDEESGQSFLKANPSVRMRSDALRLMNTFLSKFGLDPKSRAGLIVNDGKGKYAPPQKEDALERFLADAQAANAAGPGDGRKPN